MIGLKGGKREAKDLNNPWLGSPPMLVDSFLGCGQLCRPEWETGSQGCHQALLSLFLACLSASDHSCWQSDCTYYNPHLSEAIPVAVSPLSEKPFAKEGAVQEVFLPSL